jgi:uncharacterized protein YndB with AHSA1/START domain
MTLNTQIVGNAAMLIRKPVAEVFEAFVNPEITTKFWFTKGSDRLDSGNKVRWDWEMYGVASDVEVTGLATNERIVMNWGEGDVITRVEWTFTPHDTNFTFVEVTESGFTGTDDEKVQAALGSTGGFSWTLAGLKAYLEHGIQLNLVADRFPKGLIAH